MSSSLETQSNDWIGSITFSGDIISSGNCARRAVNKSSGIEFHGSTMLVNFDHKGISHSL